MIFRIQGLFKDLPKFSQKFKDLSRISRIGMKFKDFKDFFKDVATLGMWYESKCCQKMQLDVGNEPYLSLQYLLT